MKPTLISVAAGALLFTAGCASPPDQYPPLANLQARFDETSRDGTAQYAPVEFDDARAALQAAQDALGQAEEDRLEHLTYMADTRLRIATARADQKRFEKERRQLADQRDNILLRSAQAELQAERARADQVRHQLALYRQRRSEAGVVLTLRDVNFTLDSAQLQPGDQRNLSPLADYLNANPEQKIRIEGFTDSQGASDYNRDLSRRRAESVEAFLIARGIGADRIETAGLGESLPVASNETAAGRLENRRIEVTLIDDRRG